MQNFTRRGMFGGLMFGSLALAAGLGTALKEGINFGAFHLVLVRCAERSKAVTAAICDSRRACGRGANHDTRACVGLDGARRERDATKCWDYATRLACHRRGVWNRATV